MQRVKRNKKQRQQRELETRCTVLFPFYVCIFYCSRSGCKTCEHFVHRRNCEQKKKTKIPERSIVVAPDNKKKKTEKPEVALHPFDNRKRNVLQCSSSLLIQFFSFLNARISIGTLVCDITGASCEN